MIYDDLPIRGFLGMIHEEGKYVGGYKYSLYRHTHFDMFYNDDHVIEIIADANPFELVDLTPNNDIDVEFTYSVKWKETSTPFEKRMEKYSLTSSQLHHLQIHWFSILNSCYNLLLIGFLATIPMRMLKNDFVNKTEFQVRCQTNKYPREIPPLPWYQGTIPQMVMAGFLPFGAIYIELFYIFGSLWGHRIYTIYSILFIVFSILLIVTTIIDIALTYFQLASKDHEWWWR
ncbi:unnamed protein product [Musa banksii]